MAPFSSRVRSWTVERSAGVMVTPALRRVSVRDGLVLGRTRAFTVAPRLISAFATSWPSPPVAPATAINGEVISVIIVG